MGNLQKCSQGCFSWLKGYSETITKLRQLYRSKYRSTIFYQNCLAFVEQLHRLSQNGHGLDDEIQNYKGSLIESLHYEQSAIDKNSADVNQGLPSRITSLTQSQKKQLISELIKKSYILLDISDIFDEQGDSIIYESQIKHKIFQNDQSMMTESFFFQSRDQIADSLRKFDIGTIYKLEKYVEMAERIRKAFDITTESLLSKFLLHLKSKLIEVHNSSENIDQLFKNTRQLLSILEQTIIVLFDLSIPKKDHQRKNSNVSNQSWEDGQGIQFLNQSNLYTLVCCIVFDEAGFHQFYEKAILDRFKVEFGKYKKQSAVTDQFFAGRVLGEKDNLDNFFEPTLVGLFNKRAQDASTFQKTIKMFNKLPTKYPPVLKLKLLAQVQKQFLRQLKKLCTKKNTEMIYDRMTAQLMASWLLNRDKAIGEKCIVSIIVAYAFVHGLYRLGAKGSTILSFVEGVEKILGWAIPTQ